MWLEIWFDLGRPDASTGREYSTLEDVDFRLTDYVVEKSIIPSLDLSIKEEDVN